MRNPRVSNGHRRRELRRRILADPNETHCGICHQPVDKTLPHGLPGSPEIDEIVPVSLGGNPLDRTNCRLTHRLCNVLRGNGTRPTTTVRAPIQPLTTTRTWEP